jgi:hypothetical protein
VSVVKFLLENSLDDSNAGCSGQEVRIHRPCARLRRPMKTVNSKPHTVPVTDVLVGSRIRRDLGNIDELARSIAEVGLLPARSSNYSA